MMQMSKEYASALFTLSKENHSEKEIAEGLELVKEVFELTPEYYAFLSSPGISKQKRLDSIKDAFSGKVPLEVVYFLCVLCEHAKVKLLGECIEEFKKLYSESKKVTHALVTSVVELTDKQKDNLRIKLENLKKTKIEMHYAIDPALLGGVTVELDGMFLDSSLKRRLKTIKGVMDE